MNNHQRLLIALGVCAFAALPLVDVHEGFLEAQRADRHRQRAERLIERNDKDGDGKLNRSECPLILVGNFRVFDTSGDNLLDVDELTEAYRKRSGGSSDDNAASEGDGDDWHYWGDGFLWKQGDAPYSVNSQPQVRLHDAEREKQLFLRVTWPELPEKQSSQPLPVIIFSHGAGGDQDAFQPVVKQWASHGYVVVQPTHADSVSLHDGGLAAAIAQTKNESAWQGRVSDITSIIDQLAALPGLVEQAQQPDSEGSAEATGKPLKLTLDHTCITLAGHSFGAWTTMLCAGLKISTEAQRKAYADALEGAQASGHPAPVLETTSHAEPRIASFIAFSPQGISDAWPAISQQSYAGLERPILFVTGSEDRGLGDSSAEIRRHPFEYAPEGGKYFLWIEGADHGSFGRGTSATGRRQQARSDKANPLAASQASIHAYVCAASQAFLDATLRRDKAALGYLGSDALHQSSAITSASDEPKGADNAQRYQLTFERKVGDFARPTEAGMKRLAAYSDSVGGLSLLIQHRGKVIFEHYAEGHDAGKATMLASGTKSFWGPLAQMAVQDGLFALDDLVCDTINEWKEDPRKSKITVRMLLSLTSGLDPATDALQGFKRYSKYDHAISVEATREPGTTFQYGPAAFFSFGEFLRRKLEAHEVQRKASENAAAQSEGGADKPEPIKQLPLNVEAYLKARILDPLGIKVANWTSEPDGKVYLPHGAFLTAREWAKYGEFLRSGCAPDGTQLLPLASLQECVHGTDVNPGYGLTIWLNAGPGDQGHALSELQTVMGTTSGIDWRLPHDAFMAAGKGKQRLYVIPSLELVIVRQSREVRPAWSDRDAVGHLWGE